MYKMGHDTLLSQVTSLICMAWICHFTHTCASLLPSTILNYNSISQNGKEMQK